MVATALPPCAPCSHVLDERLIWRWIDPDGLLHQPVEQFSAMSGCAPVEAECELVEVIVQMGHADGTLMRAKEPPFEQGNHTVNPGQQVRRRFLASFEECDLMPVAMFLETIITEKY